MHEDSTSLDFFPVPHRIVSYDDLTVSYGDCDDAESSIPSLDFVFNFIHLVRQLPDCNSNV